MAGVDRFYTKGPPYNEFGYNMQPVITSSKANTTNAKTFSYNEYRLQ